MLQTKQDMSRELLSHLSKNLLKNKLAVSWALSYFDYISSLYR